MKNKVLKQIVTQIKKYELALVFSNGEEFKKWVSHLNNTQIENFLSLNINIEEIREVRRLLVNNDLLNCRDYIQKVEAISKLKNGEGCWHLYDNICKPKARISVRFFGI